MELFGKINSDGNNASGCPGEWPMNTLTTKIDDRVLWQDAQDRVLLYLKKLGMPAIQSLEIAHTAMKQAMADVQAGGSGSPVQLAMRALHAIIINDISIMSHSSYKEYPILFRRWHWENIAPQSQPSAVFSTHLEPSASPPINRGSMMIKKI